MTYEEEYKKLEHLKVDKKMWKESIRAQTRKTHKKLYEKNKGWVRTLDICVIIIILLNYGALFITNALVVRENPEIVLLEANEVQAEMNDLKEHPEGDQLMRMLILQTLFWAFLVSSYLLHRYYTYNYIQMFVTTVLVVFYVTIISFDFVNNFGYLVGTLLWGA